MKYTMLTEKPYGFVPLVNTKLKYKSETPTPHNFINKYKYSGKLFLSIHTITDIHLGSSIFNFNNGEPYKAFMRKGEDLIIAGSSLKGVVRSISEAISFSCAPLVYPKGLEYALESNNQKHCTSEKLCITCSMFGMQNGRKSYKGKISFRDFILEDKKKYLKTLNIPVLEKPFKNYPSSYTGNPRLYYCNACNEKCEDCTKMDFFKRANINAQKTKVQITSKFRGRKFYYTDETKLNKEKTIGKSTPFEFVNKNATFNGEIVFQNLTEDELGLLAYSLGLTGDFTPKLGYAKSLGHGVVAINLKTVEDYITRYVDVENPLSVEMIKNFAKKYKDTIIEKNQEIKTANNALCKILSPIKVGV